MVKELSEKGMMYASIIKKSGLHPFVVKKMLSAVTHLSLTDIKRLYQKILDLEQGTKQGKHDLEDGLFSLALN